MRNDKRRDNQIRSLKLKPNVSRYAEGSCLVEMGNTHVLCAASVEERVPRFLRNSNRGWVTAEYGMLPRSCNQRITREVSKGRVSGRTSEIQRLVGRSLRAVMDFDKLGQRTIIVDCDVLQGDGGTRCASISGAYVALHLACQKLLKAGTITEWPIKDSVAAVSVGIVKGIPRLDLNYEEDSSADVDMNIIMTGRGLFIEVQGTAENNPFTDVEMKKLISLAKIGIKSITSLQIKTLKNCL